MKLSLVIPVYNEEKIIDILRERLSTVLAGIDLEREIILVDDGSRDATAVKIREWIAADASVILLQFSRNFGHQAAISAGLQESTGDCVVIIDADLQDPPEIIPEMIAKWREGNKVVLAERTSRGENFFKRCLFNSFYKVFSLFSDLPAMSSGVFGLMDRVVVNHLIAMKEHNRFIPGLRSWIGYRRAVVWYERKERIGGEAKQSLKRLIRYGLDAVFSFSYKPLRFSFFFGVIVSLCCFAYGFTLIVLRLLNINLVLGFTTMAVAVFFLGGVILVTIGILGEYIGRIYDEVKHRPLYIVASKTSRNPDERDVQTVECT